MRVTIFLCLCLAAMPGITAAKDNPGGHAVNHETEREISPSNAELLYSAERIHSGSLNYAIANGRANITGLYYGSEVYDVGAFGISWEASRCKRLGLPRWLGIAPGLSAVIIKDKSLAIEEPGHGHGEKLHQAGYRSAKPAFSLRWRAENRRLVTEGTILQALLATGGRRNFYSDGAHASIRLKGWEFGGTMALANHYLASEDKLERERKGGARIARRLSHGFSAVGIVLWPSKPEWRGGLVYQTQEH